MIDQKYTLDCQDCGDVVAIISAAQAQKVADNPYNYIVWCEPCRIARGMDKEWSR